MVQVSAEPQTSHMSTVKHGSRGVMIWACSTAAGTLLICFVFLPWLYVIRAFMLCSHPSLTSSCFIHAQQYPELHANVSVLTSLWKNMTTQCRYTTCMCSLRNCSKTNIWINIQNFFNHLICVWGRFMVFDHEVHQAVSQNGVYWASL